jgi:hypothetical protein
MRVRLIACLCHAPLQAVPQPPNTATAWVMASGALLSVDATFTDM